MGFCVAMTRNGGSSCSWSVDGDAPFGHRFQQRGLRPRRGAVDFVGQHDLREERAGAKLELGGLWIENGSAGDVGRQQIGRALDAFERAADALREGAGQHGFGHAGHVFQQDVAFAKVGDQGQDDLCPFADDHVLDVGDDPIRRL